MTGIGQVGDQEVKLALDQVGFVIEDLKAVLRNILQIQGDIGLRLYFRIRTVCETEEPDKL